MELCISLLLWPSCSWYSIFCCWPSCSWYSIFCCWPSHSWCSIFCCLSLCVALSIGSLLLWASFFFYLNSLHLEAFFLWYSSQSDSFSGVLNYSIYLLCFSTLHLLVLMLFSPVMGVSEHLFQLPTLSKLFSSIVVCNKKYL